VTVVRYEPEGLDELEASVEWYERERPGLGHRFAVRVEDTVDRIAEAPKSFPVVLRVDGTEVHRALLDKFPYAIVFLSLRQAEVRILAVARLRRRPDYWRGRV
jgi:toxin ParE1/3/4